MPILEGRAILYALRHALRTSGNFGRRIAVLGDALVASCAVSKGRSDSRAMLRVTQSVAALCLATGCVLHCRWLPSEWNVADGPSRGLAVPSLPQPLSLSKPHELRWLEPPASEARGDRDAPAPGGCSSLGPAAEPASRGRSVAAAVDGAPAVGRRGCCACQRCGHDAFFVVPPALLRNTLRNRLPPPPGRAHHTRNATWLGQLSRGE